MKKIAKQEIKEIIVKKEKFFSMLMKGSRIAYKLLDDIDKIHNELIDAKFNGTKELSITIEKTKYTVLI